MGRFDFWELDMNGFSVFFLRNFHIQRWCWYLFDCFFVSFLSLDFDFIHSSRDIGHIFFVAQDSAHGLVFKIRLPSRSLWRETCFTLKLLDHWWVGLGFSSKLIMTWKMALSCSEDQDSSIPAFFTSILKTLFVDVCCVFLSAMVSLFRFHLPFQRCNFQMSETPPGPLDAWKTGGIFESSGGDGNDAPGAF